MKIFYSDQPLTSEAWASASIFLAGPTPRSESVKSWRPDALKILENLKFDGVVFIPEYLHKSWVGSTEIDYTDQVDWEFEALQNCTVVAFWIPRAIDSMPAFTTNVEFGRYVDKPSTVYGRPDSSPGNKYLDWLWDRTNGWHGKPFNDLTETLNAAALHAATIFEVKVTKEERTRRRSMLGYTFLREKTEESAAAYLEALSEDDWL